jgi:DNA repair exonuclease SbcCD nuclease subunit
MKADLLLTSDWHLREDQPICRTDNFWEEQWKKVDFIYELQKEHKCDVIHAGDLFHHWKPSPYLLSETMRHLPQRFLTIYGQHDLPQHSLELSHKCGINTLEAANILSILPGTHFGMNPLPVTYGSGSSKPILVWHRLVWQGKPPWPGCTDPSATEVLEQNPEYGLIITGDNHQTFTCKHDGRWLVNPGSLSRQKSDQEKHRPVVFLWFEKTNEIQPIYIPIQKGVVTREHLEKKEERDDRIEAFIARLNGGWEVGDTFEENLTQFTKENVVRPSVIEIINRAME